MRSVTVVSLRHVFLLADNATFVRLGPTTLTLNGAVVATAIPVPTVNAPAAAAIA